MKGSHQSPGSSSHGALWHFGSACWLLAVSSPSERRFSRSMAPVGAGRWQPGSWTAQSPYLLLAVVLALAGPVRGQQCSLSNALVLQFTDLGANFSVFAESPDSPGNWEPLYSMVQLFLDVVQPNPFPSELLREVLNNSSDIRAAQVVKYEAGFVVCAVIAGLYLIVMILTGLIFFVRRFRGQCGGFIESISKNFTYTRNGLILALLLTTILMLAGVICAFATNEKTKQEMAPSAHSIPSSLQGFRLFLTNIPQAVDTIVSEFLIPKERVLEDLKTVGQTIGNSLSSTLTVTVYPLLVAAEQTAQDLQNALHNLQDLQSATQSVQQRQQELETALQGQRQNITDVLSMNSCVSCANTLSRVPSLELEANFSKVPSLDAVLSNLDDATKINMPGIFQTAIDYFNKIQSIVDAKSAEVLQSTLVALDRAEAEVRSIAAQLQIQRYTASFSNSLLKAEDESRQYTEEVKRYDHYRWIVGIVLCVVVLLIIACNFLGLSFGMWGLYRRSDLTEANSIGETGANLLMSGAGLSFLFSWLLILLVFITFVVGGNFQTLICKSWANGNVYRFLDDPANLPPSMNLTSILGLKQNINFTSIYEECKEGAAFWDILPLEKSYNIDEALDISKYTASFKASVDNITIDLEDFILMKSIAMFWLREFQISGIDQINYSLFITEIETPLIRTSLEEFAAELERLAAVQTNTTVRSQLTEEASALRDLQSSTVQAQAVDVQKMNASVQVVVAVAPTVQSVANKTLADLDYMEIFLNVDLQGQLRNETTCFMDKEIGYFVQYVNWVNRTLTQHIASCRPISASLDNIRVSVCENVINPWNAFWFSLGWCTLLLIPSIIFAVKTSKYFRPVRRRLSIRYTEVENVFKIPRVTSVNL